MNIKKIEEVINLMEKHDLSEISVEEEGMKIHLKRGLAGQIEKTVQMANPVLTPIGQVHAPPVTAETRNVIEIKAPMVGTFYRSPSPDTKSFTEVGSTVNEGDVLCIIEAMKLMNEIKSEIKGKIVDVLVENSEPIEYGQVLFLIEPA